MPTEFTVTLRNTPGALAEIGVALGEKGINIEALQAISIGDQSVLHVVVNDPDGAMRELEDHGLPYRCREVVEADVRNEPGTLGRLAVSLSSAGINIDSAYLSINQRVLLGVSDPVGAAAIMRSLTASP